MAGNYRDLIVWQKSLALTKAVYLLTESFPKSQMFVLANRMQRAALSIPSNIAEGYNRQYTTEYRQFLSISYGSAGELETQILLATELGFAQNAQVKPLFESLEEIAKMLHAMIRKLKEAA